jgi:hypothetical protein
MATLPRQPLNNIAPFRVYSPEGGSVVTGYQITTPELMVGTVVFSDGSTMTTASGGGSLPEFLDGGTY